MGMENLTYGEGCDLVKDPLTILIWATVLLGARWTLHQIFTRWWAKRLIGLPAVGKLSPADSLGVEKFCKYFWHAIVYLVLFVWGLRILMTEAWSPFKTGTMDSVWIDYPHPASEKPVLKAFVMAQVAWYAHGFVESLIVDKFRSDFIVMLVHHVMSAILLLGSFYINGHRVAIVVCVEQDLSDILMYISKMFQKSVKVPWTQNQSFRTYLLVQLTTAWWSTRVFVLGTLVYRCLVILAPTGLMVIGGDKAHYMSIFLVGQLGLLWVMQVFWAVGLLKMTIDQVAKGAFNDFFHDSKKNEAKLSNKVK
mmetsp:Transcript_2421/g.4888  ORF Transcript_2421/g.4888 Transcript_2421/m.4888 type:complete len:308 (+) Transcript_2421:37-960(+)|eukprot:CAMPEP_0173391746 /NCGR_PEP_ID=MMETSP1356-20130122/18565_1 /TAXON_ID=77927 ORGANISM="Hemiselmis virescens, Strain PCC157" /NCGR_SAMPLE_ID=MMETSP1356 /ASSEMBLY_ACC=CAM_ASM_000847 /LENGTH=307 /DNA_ID=CAMNT_0014349429 /DNA_START=35 /DNA_END=958 /DNA_ORIENTATION=-